MPEILTGAETFGGEPIGLATTERTQPRPALVDSTANDLIGKVLCPRAVRARGSLTRPAGPRLVQCIHHPSSGITKDDSRR